jgi:hypothetical protein
MACPIFVNDDGGEQMAVNVERYTLLPLAIIRW